MNSLNRRTFLKTTSVVAAGFALGTRSWAQVVGANSDLRVAVVGVNGRGVSHIGRLMAIKGVRVVAICDADTAVMEKLKARKDQKSGATPYANLRTYVDLRELLAASDIDAITIATPNHLHALQAIWAVEAGKDVYVEKPVSHNVWEGRQLVAATSKFNRVVQAGTQIRSGSAASSAPNSSPARENTPAQWISPSI